jgi:hypothetical protein
MKHLRETFTDEEMVEIQQAKGKRTWREFILGESRKINLEKEKIRWLEATLKH